MDKDTISRLTVWYRSGFGHRQLCLESPYFVMSPPAPQDHRDARRRQFLAGQAGL